MVPPASSGKRLRDYECPRGLPQRNCTVRGFEAGRKLTGIQEGRESEREKKREDEREGERELI